MAVDPSQLVKNSSSRRYVGALIGVGLSLLLGERTVSAEAPAPATPTLVEQARDAYVRRDFVTAARAYELLFADTGAAKYLFNAGMAREAAGHDALAIHHWEQFLREERESSPAERAQLRDQIDAARRRTGRVRLVLEGAAPVGVELRYTLGELGDPLLVEVSGPTDIDLDPGTWSLRIAGSKESARTFTVASGEAPIELGVAAKATAEVAAPAPSAAPAAPQQPRSLTLRLAPARAVRRGISVTMAGPTLQARTIRTAESRWNLAPGEWTVNARVRGYVPHETNLGSVTYAEIQLVPDRRRQARIGVSIGLGALGLAAIAGGAAGSHGARRDYLAAYNELDPRRSLADGESDGLLRSIRIQATGLGLMGSGLGLGVATTTWIAGGGRRLLIAEAGIGGGLMLAGTIGVALSVRAYERSRLPGEKWTRDDLDGQRPRDLALSTLLGAGVGLFVGAVTGLVLRGSSSKTGRERERVRIRGSWTSVFIEGRF